MKTASTALIAAIFSFITISVDAASPTLERSMGLYFESPSAHQRLQELVRDPSAILRAFVPNGILFSRFRVAAERYMPRMEFQGEPKSEFVKNALERLGFPTSFPIVGELHAEVMECRASGYLPQGYRFTLKLERSHALIAQDVSAVEFLFCQKQRPDSKVELHGKGRLVLTPQAGRGKAGDHPSEIASWQFWSFWHALKTAVEFGSADGLKQEKVNDSDDEAAPAL